MDHKSPMGICPGTYRGMGQQTIMLFNRHNINAFVDAPVKAAHQLVDDFIADRLCLNANYCNHDDH